MLIVATSLTFTAHAAALEKITDAFHSPWSIEFLSKRQLLITERSGNFFIFDLEIKKATKIQSTLKVWFSGQGGLLDVGFEKSYQTGNWIYVTYSKPDGDGASTALARFKLKDNTISSFEDLFVSNAISDGGRHFGSRITFDQTGHVFISSGDRGDRDLPQDLSSHAGKIIRLKLDGSIPTDNPFVNVVDAQPEIWSYGHRNPQGLFYDAPTKRLWSIEHGPRGGDEINLIEKGKNYGWPVISYGKEYWGPIAVGEGTHREGMEQPLKEFTPSIAPGSLIVFRSKRLPELDNSLLSGALKLQHINQVELVNDNRLGKEERLFEDLNERIRDLAVGPEGGLYFITDSGGLYRYW